MINNAPRVLFSIESNMNTQIQSVKKADNIRNNDYCCVPKCKNGRLTFPNLSFHNFPKDKTRHRTFGLARYKKRYMDQTFK